MFQTTFSRSLGRLLRASLSIAAGAAAVPVFAGLGGFDPNADGNVYAVVAQPDGKIIVAGGFENFRPNHSGTTVVKKKLARIVLDGWVDTSFNPPVFNGDVRALAVDLEGGIIVAGTFTKVGDHARAGLARLLGDGSLDPNFIPTVTGDPSVANPTLPLVRAFAVQPDGAILVAGGFTKVEMGGGESRACLARLRKTGASWQVDPSFTPSANNVVLALLVQRDGRIVIGGGFTEVTSSGAATPSPRLRLARLDSAGAVDSTFTVAADNRVLAIAEQLDGGLLVGGEFLKAGDGASSMEDRRFLCRIASNGLVDPAFTTTASAAVENIALQTDGRILLGGRFTWVQNASSAATVSRSRLARLGPDGKVDTDFTTAPNQQVTAIAVLPSSQIVIGGYFTQVASTGTGSLPRGRLARLQDTGLLDADYRPESGGIVLALARYTEGADARLLVGGEFGSWAGMTSANLVQTDGSGALRAAFKPAVNGRVLAIQRQSDGKVLIGGHFTRVGTEDRYFLARLNADGTLDTAFHPTPNSYVAGIGLQSDGKIVVVGQFNSIAPDATTEGTIRNCIARLNPDGTLDTAFDPNASGYISAVVVQPDGKILVGGEFTNFLPNGAKTGVPRAYIARLETNGTVDTTFTARVNAKVFDLALGRDGQVIAGGEFTSVGVIGSADETVRYRAARFSASGAVDPAFDPNLNGTVYALGCVAADDSVVIGGAFTKKAEKVDAENTNYYDTRFLTWVDKDGKRIAARDYQANGWVTAILVADATVTLGGEFTEVFGTDVSIPAESHVARLLASGGVDSAFSPVADAAVAGEVRTAVRQEDGRQIVGGSFGGVLGGSNSTNLARVRPDGTIDAAFEVRADGAVNAVLLRLQEAFETGPVAWLTNDGTLRPQFGTSATASLWGNAYGVAVDASGRLLVGGLMNHDGFPEGHSFARFNADGSLDRAFKPNPNRAVNVVEVLSDGRILIGGIFDKVGETSCRYLARVSAEGAPDTTFLPKPDGQVLALAVDASGGFYAGGEFTKFQPAGQTVEFPRPFLAHFNADGTLDLAFAPQFNAKVSVVVRLGDGRLLVAGDFTRVGTTVRNRIARLAADGTLDTDFDPNANGSVHALAVQADGKILVGGEFTAFAPSGATTTVRRSSLARLNADGTVDTAFNTSANDMVQAIAVQADGKIVVGGAFTSVQPGASEAVRRNYLARLQPDGTPDPEFVPDVDGGVIMLRTVVVGTVPTLVVGGSFNAVNPPAPIVVGGSFAHIGGAARSNLARVGIGGSIDGGFNPGADGEVFALAAQPVGATEAEKVLVGGAFDTIGTASRGGLARVNGDGTVDLGFAPADQGTVTCLLVQPDRRVLVAREIGGRTEVARLEADGAAHAGFATRAVTVDADAGAAAGTIDALALQADGKILVGGRFGAIGGVTRGNLARLHSDGSVDLSFAPPTIDGEVQSIALQADGRIFIGGTFGKVGGVDRARLARLESDGGLDATWTEGIEGTSAPAVRTVSLLPDGNVFVGGRFTKAGGRSRFLAGRLSNDSLASRRLEVSPDRTLLTWVSDGSSPDFGLVRFAWSADRTTWTDLGPAFRPGEAGVWKGWVTGTVFPDGAFRYIRARGVQTSSANASAGRFETEWQVYGGTPVPTHIAGATVVGGSSRFSMSTIGGPGVTYQWQRDGVDIAGATGATYTIPITQASDAGTYTCRIRASDGAVAVSAPVVLEAPQLPSSDTRLLNASTRAFCGTGDSVLIPGFVISGVGNKRLLLRAVGPELIPFGVAAPLADPQMRLEQKRPDGSWQTIAQNDDWGASGNAADIPSQAALLGAFPLAPASTSAALLMDVPPGIYTIMARGNGGGTGIAIVEIFDAGSDTDGSRLINISNRSYVGTGGDIMIPGFVVSEQGPKAFLIRAVGPTLAGARFGVSETLSDPRLAVYGSPPPEGGDAPLLLPNDNWGESGDAADVRAAAALVGAFALDEGSRDAAVVVTLQPGAYTVQVSGVGGSTGVALAEVYALPDPE